MWDIIWRQSRYLVPLFAHTYIYVCRNMRESTCHYDNTRHTKAALYRDWIVSNFHVACRLYNDTQLWHTRDSRLECSDKAKVLRFHRKVSIGIFNGQKRIATLSAFIYIASRYACFLATILRYINKQWLRLSVIQLLLTT